MGNITNKQHEVQFYGMNKMSDFLISFRVYSEGFQRRLFFCTQVCAVKTWTREGLLTDVNMERVRKCVLEWTKMCENCCQEAYKCLMHL